jgi:hypothetical protein
VNIFAFTRENDEDKVFAIFNLSNLDQEVEIIDNMFVGSYTELFSEEKIALQKGAIVNLKPWEFYIYVK